MLMNGMVRPPGQRFIRFQEGRDTNWACAHGQKPQRDEGMTQTSPLKVEYVGITWSAWQVHLWHLLRPHRGHQKLQKVQVLQVLASVGTIEEH